MTQPDGPHMDPDAIRKVWLARARMLKNAPIVINKLIRDAKSKEYKIRHESRKLLLTSIQTFMDEYREAVQQGDLNQLMGVQDVEFIRVCRDLASLFQDHGTELVKAIHDHAKNQEHDVNTPPARKAN